jgi:Glycoside hydrolase family 44
MDDSPLQGRAAAIALTVDAGAGQKQISPYIYGLNFAKKAFAQEIDLPVRRWGGNDTSRYNWQINATNHGSDWFFHNDTHSHSYTGAAETSDQWAAENKIIRAESLITMPMIGYVAKDGNQSTYGFSIVNYGSQDLNDKDNGFPDAGNGISDGVPIIVNDPADTSIAINETFATGWVSHLIETHGAASAGGVKFLALDNEPGLWHETHRDVHRAPLTYDESYTQGALYAAAMKTADPAVLIFGPVQDGWTRYWYASYFSQAQADADRQSHGGLAFVPWYLQRMNAYEQANGVRLLDFLDLHFYPQNGVDQALAGNAAKQALRLRSTAALWDPTYVDESWIKDAGPDGGIVRLIPRMHDWVDDNYPGTGLALTEYNWGGLEHINGALTQADILGIFGQEGLDLAALWNYPERLNSGTKEEIKYDVFETLPGAYAFRLYRNYDGNGSKFGDLSVTAASANRAELAIYAARRTVDGVLTLMVINKTVGLLTGDVALAGFAPAAVAEVYRYSNANLNVIVKAADQPVNPTGFSTSFPANSITLFVVPPAP